MGLWLSLVGWYTVDRHIRQGKLLTRAEAIWILNQATALHKTYLTAKWDTAATGTDESHLYNIGWYGKITALLRDRVVEVTITDILAFLNADVASHQYYIDHPEYAYGAVGNLAHQLKWRDRWRAIIRLIEKDNGGMRI